MPVHCRFGGMDAPEILIHTVVLAIAVLGILISLAGIAFWWVSRKMNRSRSPARALQAETRSSSSRSRSARRPRRAPQWFAMSGRISLAWVTGSICPASATVRAVTSGIMRAR